MLTLAQQTNAIPLPSVPEVFGVRIPNAPHVLTQVDFDLVPNKPPPGVPQYEEEIEEIEEDESDDEEEVDVDAAMLQQQQQRMRRAVTEQSDADMASPGAVGMGQGPVVSAAAGDEGSEGGREDDGLFGDEESEGDDAMESVEVPDVNANPNGIKRKLVEEDDYD